MKNTETQQTKVPKKQVENKLDNKELFWKSTFDQELADFFAMVNEETENDREEEYRYIQSRVNRYMQSREGGIYE